jgi:hypothetical protein
VLVAALDIQPLSRWKVVSNHFLVGIHPLAFPQWLDGSADLVRQVAQVGTDEKTGYALLDASEGNGIAWPIDMFADAWPVSGGLLVD